MKKKLLSTLFALVLVVTLGLVTAVPAMADGATYYVSTTGNDSNDGSAADDAHAWLTIQHAVDTASADDTISVAAGTYDEQVVITKSLTLQGAGDTTIIQPTTIAQTYNRKKEGGTESDPTNAIVVATVDVGTPNSITIKDLRIDSSQVSSWGTGNKNVGILYQGAAGIIDNITFTGAPSADGFHDCIYASAFEETVSVEIEYCDIVTSFDKNGITCNFAGLTADIHDNTVTGAGPIDTAVQNCIQIGFGATGSVTDNTVSNVVYDPAGWVAAGLLVSSSDAIVTGNTITDCQKGIAVEPFNAGSYTVSISNNTISSAGLKGVVTHPDYVAGISVDPRNAGATIAVTIENNDLTNDGPYCGIEFFGGVGTIDATVTGNEISGWTEAGIGTYPWGTASITVNITGNTFTNNVEEGIATWDCGSVTPPTQTITNNTITGSKWGITSCNAITTAHHNNIYGNTQYGIWNADAAVLDAALNWWGDASGPYNATSNSDGTGNAVADNVTFMPWLMSAWPDTDTSASITEEVSGSGTVTSTCTGGDVTIEAAGDHTITTAKYTGNPGGTPTFEATGDYYDVHLDSASGVDSLTVNFCPVDEDTIVYYWDETSENWKACSDQVYDGGCVLVTITDSTSPSLSDLIGLPFATGASTLNADFSATPTRGAAPLTVHFTNESTGGATPYSYEWSFGDGASSTAENPTHKYRGPGRYAVSFTITDNGDEIDSAQGSIGVQEAYEPPEPADFAASYLLVSPQQVLLNQQVEISVNIANHGGQTGTHSVVLYINGYAEQSQSVPVSPGSTKVVVFRVSKALPGTYQVSIDGMQGQFSVLGPPRIVTTNTMPSQQDTGLGTAGIVTIVVLAIILIVAVLFLFRGTGRLD